MISSPAVVTLCQHKLSQPARQFPLLPLVFMSSPPITVSRSSSITDPNLTPFLSQHFSPIEYLNATLPSSSTSSNSTNKPTSLSLSALASQTQSHVSALAAQSTRLTETLNALTDDILRVSPRLTYEVELLRGEAISLSDSLSPSGNLHASVTQFVPDTSNSSLPPVDQQRENAPILPSLDTDPAGSVGNPPIAAPIDSLRTLLHVRSRLTRVSQIFSLALSWPFPPSLLPKSSLISVSSPADHTYEAQGQAACARLRQETIDLLAEPEEGVLKAAEMVQELRTCVELWKGTTEEKARGKFVEELEEMVEEARRKNREANRVKETLKISPQPKGSPLAGIDRDIPALPSRHADTASGPGFLRNLQRLRDEIYLE